MQTPTAFEPSSRPPRHADRFALRFWSIKNARLMERTYNAVERVLVRLVPTLDKLGRARVEAPVAVLEKAVKGALFDCKMCGQCILSSTGMSCPMNCPKGLRNGPCGGVRANGNCEVYADMPCVWVKAWDGSRLMEDGDRIRDVQPPVDHRLKGTSSWLKVARDKAGAGGVSTTPGAGAKS